ncbi:hypothetical protein POX_a00206 [Penicillium oxalicum]|uniref:Uncharacterized protein n=1 Tax=Penicillium oxalicum (strain 114-2 / CGMCC 5302) TaxID=933388 RepID=S8BHY0_PENO1|nr:hypothetical protein POX_a00206 [Penicillium oxalicum]EPS34827.1 hypothetical protein PDE_09791 [Penicillium oxalicum 114-2]KAI2793624.1 hypothetical protein POX_a00206 [Penicillium oxalicum]
MVFAVVLSSSRRMNRTAQTYDWDQQAPVYFVLLGSNWTLPSGLDSQQRSEPNEKSGHQSYRRLLYCGGFGSWIL